MTQTEHTVSGEERLAFPFDPPNALGAPPEWARLRTGCPVAKVRAENGADGVVLTRYADVREMLADPRFERGSLTGDPAGAGGDDTMLAAGSELFSGERHLHWRRILGRTFTVKRVRALQPGIERIAHELIDEMVTSTPAGGAADLKAALGFPLPVFVICELLGVPASDRERFSEWSDRILNLTRYSQEQMIAAGIELYTYIQGHVNDRREHPGDDLLSALVRGADTPEGELTEHELVMTGMGLLIAGHETTANMIGKMVSMLLAPRSRWQALVADRSLVRTAVEEALRFDANLGFALSRHVDEQIEIAGTTIPAETTVWSVMASANRDESVFERADDMVLDRSPNPHISFGVGAHSCLGQALARVELQTVLSVLLERLPTLELAVPAQELRRQEGLLVGGLEEVPVRW